MLLENLQTDIFLTLASYFVFLLCCVATTLFSFKLTHYLIMGYIVKNKKYDYLFKIKIKDNHFCFYKFRLPFCSFLAVQQAKIPFNSFNHDPDHTSSSLIPQLILFNFKMRNSLFCQNINNGGCGFFAYYTIQKLNELAKQDSNLKSESIRFVFINSNNNNDTNLEPLNIDYNLELSEQFTQLHSSSWKHILVAFTYCNKQFYLDEHRLFSEHQNFVYDLFDNLYIANSNNFQLIKNNVTFDLLEATVTMDNDNNMLFPYCNNDALKPDNLNKLVTKDVSFADIKTELLFFLNQISLK